MRHRLEGRKLKRTASHRKALLRSLATSLLRHTRIRTTEAKAKEARRFAEAIITRAKRAYAAEKAGGVVDIHARRVVARDINDGDVVRKLFTEIAAKVADRPGGYTRVVKLPPRHGDAARMAILELVDYNVDRDDRAARTKKKQTISRAERVARSRAKQTETEVKAEAPAAPVVEEVAPEAVVEEVAEVTEAPAATEETTAAPDAPAAEGTAEGSEEGTKEPA